MSPSSQLHAVPLTQEHPPSPGSVEGLHTEKPEAQTFVLRAPCPLTPVPEGMRGSPLRRHCPSSGIPFLKMTFLTLLDMSLVSGWEMTLLSPCLTQAGEGG